MPRLKKLTVEGVGRAMEKAERYRLLGEPCEAESICVDVLEVAPDNHEAMVLLILALTDQFSTDLGRRSEATSRASELEDAYERCYYSGIVAERMGKVQLTKGGPSADDYANRSLWEAMTWYEKAEAVRPVGDDSAILRWNTCLRAITRRGFVVPSDMPVTGLFMTE